MNKIIITLLIVLALGVLTNFVLVLKPNKSSTSVSGVTQGNDYAFSTSTAGSSVYGARTVGGLLKTGFGSIGEITITGANTGVVNFYNATTSNVSLRTGNKATSTLLIASLPASLAAGTYTLNAGFTDGLLMVVVEGTLPTSTISVR